MVSRNTSASPSDRSRSTRATELASLAARTQPRLTARLVDPTPPVAPRRRSSDTRAIRLPSATRCAPIRSRASTNSSMPTGWVRNSLAPARMALRINCPSVLLLTTRMLHSGDASRRFWISCSALPGSVSMPMTPISGCRLFHDVHEELVPGGLGLKPTHVHPQEHRLE